MKVVLFFLLFLFSLWPSFSLAAESCDKEFFTQFREKAALHLCQISLTPSCQPARVSWDKNNRLLVGALSVAGGTTAAEAIQVGNALQVRRTMAFAEALNSGSYFSSKFYGRNIYEAMPKSRVSLTTAQVLGRMGSSAAVFLAAYFYQSDDPAHCNEMLSSSYLTMKIQGGVCKPSVAMSENVVKFISMPLSEQLRAVRDYPSVCKFYRELDQKIERELGPQTRLIDVRCEGGRPKSFTAALGQPEQKFEITPVAQGTGHLIGLKAVSLNGSMEEIEVKFKNAREIQKPKSDPKRVYEVMRGWWSASAVATACCDGTLNAVQGVCAGSSGGEGSSGVDSPKVKR